MSNFQKKKYDIENTTLQTLSQKWSAKDSSIADFACNVYATQIAQIDLLILTSDNAEVIEKLKFLREQIKTLGRALFIKRSDILTQLGIVVGKTGIRDFDGSTDTDEQL